MLLEKVMSKITFIQKSNSADPLGRGTDPWIRIRTKMSRIPNTDLDVDPASRVLRFLFSVGTTVRIPC
jgi:hypothetical protein